MSVPANLEELLGTSGAHVLAIDPRGGKTVSLPANLDIGPATIVECSGPLDFVAPSSHGSAVVAFEAAIRRGHGSAAVELIGDAPPHRLHIFNFEESDHCFVAVLIPQDAEVSPDGSYDSIAPRRSTYRVGASGVILFASPELSQMLGWTSSDLVGKSALDIIHPDDHENAMITWVELLEHPERPCRVRLRYMTKTGEWTWCEATSTNRLDDPDDPHGFTELLDVSRELAAQAALQRRETLLHRLTQALPSGVLQLDADGMAEIWNQQWHDLTGSEPSSGLGGFLESLVDGDAIGLAIEHALATNLDEDLDVAFGNTAGTSRFGSLHIRPLQKDGGPAGLLLTLDDVTSLRTYQHELAEQAQRDSLTGVYNRLGINNAFREQIDATRQELDFDHSDGATCGLAMLFLDLDEFKAINDAHGHTVGDAVLCQVAEVVTGVLRSTDIVGRLGGDEFLVMMVLDDPVEQSAAVAQRIKDALEQASNFVTEEVSLSASIGIAVAGPRDDFDSLLKRADDAMYVHKRAARQYSDRS